MVKDKTQNSISKILPKIFIILTISILIILASIYFISLNDSTKNVSIPDNNPAAGTTVTGAEEESLDAEVIYEPRGKYEFLAYLKINDNGKVVSGPKNMIFQHKDRSVLEFINLINNERKQIVVSSGWGPYSSVTYLFDYDGTLIKPLCREPSKQEISSNYKEFYKDYPDRGLCVFSADKGKSFEDIDGDNIKELIIGNSLIRHICPALKLITYKWNGEKFIIESEKEINNQPELEACKI